MGYEDLPVVRVTLELEFRSDGQWRTESGEKIAALGSAERFLRESNIEGEFSGRQSIRLIRMEAGAVYGQVQDGPGKVITLPRETLTGETTMHTDTDLMDTSPKKGEIDPRYLGYSYIPNFDGTFTITGKQGQFMKRMYGDESKDFEVYLDLAAARRHNTGQISCTICMDYLDASQY